MARREFPKSVKVQIIKRATRDGVVYCEKCGFSTKRWDIDHIDADAFQLDKSKPLTAEDGQLLCSGALFTCHGVKTAEQDIPAIAKAKRREARHLGVRKPSTLKGGNSLPSASPAHRATTPMTKIALGPPAWARRIVEQERT